MNKAQIHKIYQEFQVPKHIIAHMRGVAHVAKIISGKLKKLGLEVNRQNIINAALLHDVVRYVDFNLKESDPILWHKIQTKYHKIGHEKAMAKILEKRGEGDLAGLTAKHGFFSVWELKTLDEKILYYADKRVDKDKIVSLKIRLKEGKKRNMSADDDAKYVRATERKIFALENELIALLGESIDQF